MKNQFSDYMASRTDEQLVEILKLRSEYQPEAIDAVIQEIEFRKNRITIDNIKQTDINKKKIRIIEKNRKIFTDLLKDNIERNKIVMQYNNVVYDNIYYVLHHKGNELKSDVIELSEELSDVLSLKISDTIELTLDHGVYLLKKFANEQLPSSVTKIRKRVVRKSSKNNNWVWGLFIFVLLFLGMIVCLNQEGEDILKKYGGTIINTDSAGNYKKSINVRISRKLASEQLTQIAYYLKKKNPGYERLFILYYLPEMEVGNGAYATTHFTPELSIGLASDEVSEKRRAALNERVSDPLGELIGKWCDNSLGRRVIVQIYKVNGLYVLRQTEDGEFFEKKLKYSLVNGLKRFVYANDFGEYLLIGKDGKLRYYDREGYIYALPKMNN